MGYIWDKLGINAHGDLTFIISICDNSYMPRVSPDSNWPGIVAYKKGANKIVSPELLETIVIDALMTGESINALHKRLAENEIVVSESRLYDAKRRMLEEWKETGRQEANLYFNQELHRLDVVEKQAWQQYFAAGGNETEESVSELFEGKSESASSRRVTRTTKADSSLALKWFGIILGIQRERRKLLQLDAKIHLHQSITAVKGYVGIDPEEAWPTPNTKQQKLLSANLDEEDEWEEEDED